MQPDIKASSDSDQTKRWNGVAGQSWAEVQDLVDHIFKPFENLLVDAVLGSHPARVLDVGCGNGGTTLAMAKAFGPDALCLGVDISEPMLASARARPRVTSQSLAFCSPMRKLMSLIPPGSTVSFLASA